MVFLQNSFESWKKPLFVHIRLKIEKNMPSSFDTFFYIVTTGEADGRNFK